MEVLDYFGSDHSPFLVEPGYEPERMQKHYARQPAAAIHE
jgi:hypothetical protein